jgi:LAO/AO transport system kinase
VQRRPLRLALLVLAATLREQRVSAQVSTSKNEEEKMAVRVGQTSLSTAATAAAIRAGNRGVLARAITLVESSRTRDQAHAQELLQELLPTTGRAHRIGISGAPGVGKSTFIDQFGANLVANGHRVAVLAVDPTSSRTGGSILGDKTRMARLAASESAFIRPSPTSGTLGGVARKTRESMFLVEAAGFDVVIVETVGVGQSETAVAGMVDVFVVLLLAGGGDELQGIKKGIIEIADILVINKADGDNRKRAERTAADYQAAINMLTAAGSGWTPPVITASARDNRGLDLVWEKIRTHKAHMTACGLFEARRQDQAVAWMRDLVHERLMMRFEKDARLAAARADIEASVRAGRLLPTLAADRLLGMLDEPA